MKERCAKWLLGGVASATWLLGRVCWRTFLQVGRSAKGHFGEPTASLQQCSELCKHFINTGRKSPGDEAESASLKGQDLLLSPRKRLTLGQLAIATVICASGEPTHQLNGAYSCTDAPTIIASGGDLQAVTGEARGAI